ncbi:DNA cytosine methyltransferase [Paracoccus shanxieyensis]|jgi:DNA (cytosine-5)-methyltransferase 1|uniref:DNA cytosine methyltransferase n=1 Tax=Paracoccus shanxieyensis TaxID=2675752 RepID=A0A6L6J424_9RHOB|nr:DNA cytosine methyltransferase [Paracoccus shanxieyensis]MTH66588.1 DNA cytosine methyltransferase [Paracoccus shanxieyensis]MTH89823.1 DNA cytosine methyltransferase [Paracoccus shanxieyensis]
MAVYYNDSDPAACAWLRDLIAAGHLPAGEVDERSILDVEPSDLRGFTQCHFFAGIGGWPHALRLAGVAEDRPVWTGSPPCQPFSQAGQRKGQNDDRHLAPAFLRLVAACRPDLVFGEQVASAAVLGPSGRTAATAAEGTADWAWFDALATDLEAASYAVAAADLPAACIGAPHIRQRLFFGAVSLGAAAGGLGHGLGARSQGRRGMSGGADQRAAGAAGLAGGLADADGRIAGHGELQRGRQYRCQPQDGGADRLVECAAPTGTGATDGIWRDPDWLRCRDGRWRPVEPGTFPLADGIPGRMGLLRGYGNAIVPPLAAEFVTAFLECLPEGLRCSRAA